MTGRNTLFAAIPRRYECHISSITNGYVPHRRPRVAGPTVDSGCDVVVQQQLRVVAIRGNGCSQPSASSAWPTHAAHPTLGYCWASASFGGVSTFSGMLIVAIGVIIDLGLIGNGRGAARR